MSESHLTTGWICVATEGETIDQRAIEAEWLTEMAASYDPGYYTALIWEEHNRHWKIWVRLWRHGLTPLMV